MRRSIKNTAMILIITFSIFLTSFPVLATDVSGIIDTDVIWTSDKSPYNVTGNILIKQNVRLDIEPGVIIRFKTVPIESAGYYIRTDGTLNAQGNEENPIIFTAENIDRPWGFIVFTDTSTDWDETASAGCVLSHCIIEYGGNSEDSASVLCVSASPLIKNNIIRHSAGDGIRSVRGFQKIINNLIHDNKTGINISCEGGLIEDNYITDNHQGIYLGSSTYQIEIKNNTIVSSSSEIYGNCMSINLYYNSDASANETAAESVAKAEAAVTAAEAAIEAAAQAEAAIAKASDDEAYWAAVAVSSEASAKASAAAAAANAAIRSANAAAEAAAEAANKMTAKISVYKNHIQTSGGNAIAIAEHNPNANYELSFTENNIENPEGNLSVYVYDWKDEDPRPLDMTNNWWGTTETSEIDEMIFDFNNNYYFPQVKYQPVATEAIPAAGSGISYPETDVEPEQPGIISKDTLWTLDKSPYIITGNILIKENVRLEIEPGVVIQFKTAPISSVGYYIRVDGMLKARGDEGNPILFTTEDASHAWGCIAFTDTSADWDEALSAGSVLSHCVIEYAGNTQTEGSLEFGSAAVRCSSASPLIKNNIIRYSSGDGIRAYGGFQKIISNLVHDNAGFGINISSQGVVENNYMANNRQGIYLSSGEGKIEIKNNTIESVSTEFYGSCISINLYRHDDASEILIHKNRIQSRAGNAIAITEQNINANYELSLTENNIENSDGNLAAYLNNWKTENPESLDMMNNWWGTTDMNKISQMIYDSKNDFYLPQVKYQPIATEEIPGTGSDISYSETDEDPDSPWVISEDIIWTAEESPHIITGNVWIRENITLEIEPGAEVKFKTAPVQSVGYYIKVDGTLNAQGTEDKPILFTAEKPESPWGCIAFTDKSADWDEKTSSGSVISNCMIEHAGGNSQDGDSQVFGGAAVKCFSASPLIANNLIRYSAGDGIVGHGGFQKIMSNRIHNNNRAIILLSDASSSQTGTSEETESSVIANNYLMNNSQGIYLSSMNGKKIEVRNNTVTSLSPVIYGSCLSVNLYPHAETSEIRIYKNLMQSSAGNAIAITESEPDTNYELSLTENNIENSEGNLSVYLYDWQTENQGPLNMADNWWGTTHPDEIDLMIYDSKNDFYLPRIGYHPIAAEEISDAGSDLSYPPIANAGADQPSDSDQPIDWDTTVTLDGSDTFDPDNMMSCQWTQTGGPPVTLNDAASINPSFVAPPVETDDAVLTFQLTVTDVLGLYDTDEVSVTINEVGKNVEQDKGQCFISGAARGFSSGSAFMLLLIFLVGVIIVFLPLHKGNRA